MCVAGCVCVAVTQGECCWCGRRMCDGSVVRPSYEVECVYVVLG